MSFGEKLRRLRGDRSQKQVAGELDMPVTTLSTLENQETVPRGEVVNKLAAHFNVPVNYFYAVDSSNKRSDAALNYFRSIKRDVRQAKDVVAFHADEIVDQSLNEQMAKVIKKLKDGDS